MRKILNDSLMTTVIAVFAMAMLLFFLNTQKPLILLIPPVSAVSEYFVIKSYLLKKRKPVTIGAIAVLFGVLAAGTVIVLVRIL